MLKIEDYNMYIKKARQLSSGSGRNPLQLARYYLGKWGKVERNISRLTEKQARLAKTLFATLNEMTADERNFLADKYRVDVEGSKDSRSDKKVAEMYGMDVKEYTEIRQAVLYKFYVQLTSIESNNTT